MATLITLSNCCEYSSRTVDGLRQCSNRFPSSYIWAQCDPSIIQFPKKCQKTILWCFDQFTYLDFSRKFTVKYYITFRTHIFSTEWSKNDYAKRDFLVKHHMYLALDSLTFFPYCLSKSSFCLRKKLVELTLSGDGWLFWATTIIVKKINFRQQ